MDEKTPEKEFEQKTIRTYEGDIAEAIEHKKTSQVSMALAENKREIQADQGQGASSIMVGMDNQKPPSSLGKNMLKILVSLILIAGGVLGGYYLYSISPLAVKTPAAPAAAPLIPSIITPDLQKTLNVQGSGSAQILQQIQSQSASGLSDGGILEIVPYVSNTKITPVQFISDIGLAPPDMLTRSLTDSWMLGIHDSAGTPEPFIILTTSFFQNTFSGMLQWEPTMPDDLSKLFNINITTSPEQQVIPQQPAATSSGMASSSSAASTTIQDDESQSMPPPANFFSIRGSFSDKVIQDKDVREFTGQNGQTLFLYAFIDDTTLVIARDEATLSDIITRFEKRAYVR